MATEQEPTPTDTRSGSIDEKQDDTASQTDGTVTEYPTKAKLTLITIGVCLAVFLMALDNSIIATAIPRITDQFHSLQDVGWYGSAYLLCTAALQLQFGKLYTFLSIKWTFLSAIGVFELGSLLCGVAQSSTMLIIGRAIAGLGAAGIYSGAVLIVANSVPLEKRPAYMYGILPPDFVDIAGLVGSMYGISSIAGPLLGGAFTDNATWRWCFYINLPIGGVVVALIVFFFPQPHQHKPPPEPLLKRIDRFDPIGTFLLIPAVVCLLLALQWGGIKYPWSNGRIIALLVLAGILVIAFIGVQIWKQENATLPPRILKSRTVWASALFAFGLGASFFLAVYYIPIWFQAVKGTSAVGSGIRNLPMMLSAVLLSVVAGIFITMQGQYAPWLYLGTIFTSVGAGLLTTWEPDTKSSVWIGYQIVYGIGIGFALQQPLVAVQTVLEIKDIAVGASLIVFIQSIGGAIFTSVGNTVLTNQIVSNLAKHAPSVPPMLVLGTGASELKNTFSEDVLPGIVLSYNDALQKVFLVCTVMAAFTIIGSLCIEWNSVKGKKIEMGVA
ncbi:hypothetical protein N0V90_013511 [Kalmusia sp. IMI 367209]|nr:hypothetical protein N0V90_013511 [Kalmusia sp. IMI 367209]